VNISASNEARQCRARDAFASSETGHPAEPLGLAFGMSALARFLGAKWLSFLAVQALRCGAARARGCGKVKSSLPSIEETLNGEASHWLIEENNSHSRSFVRSHTFDAILDPNSVGNPESSVYSHVWNLDWIAPSRSSLRIQAAPSDRNGDLLSSVFEHLHLRKTLETKNCYAFSSREVSKSGDYSDLNKS
jgi:hypothetical protein